MLLGGHTRASLSPCITEAAVVVVVVGDKIRNGNSGGPSPPPRPTAAVSASPSHHLHNRSFLGDARNE
ncbi:hypothetical protein E2C01_058849 [Portunus trituberculatus]|uniref:Uncharacterized protein n=1 Tax=Portunus trituberculatus TaxID=210409 RepID=A0A5B7H4C2_PORTR|nr:hypothetical protein [Portunus trituberculatus]